LGFSSEDGYGHTRSEDDDKQGLSESRIEEATEEEQLGGVGVVTIQQDTETDEGLSGNARKARSKANGKRKGKETRKRRVRATYELAGSYNLLSQDVSLVFNCVVSQALRQHQNLASISSSHQHLLHPILQLQKSKQTSCKLPHLRLPTSRNLLPLPDSSLLDMSHHLHDGRNATTNEQSIWRKQNNSVLEMVHRTIVKKQELSNWQIHHRKPNETGKPPREVAGILLKRRILCRGNLRRLNSKERDLGRMDC